MVEPRRLKHMSSSVGIIFPIDEKIRRVLNIQIFQTNIQQYPDSHLQAMVLVHLHHWMMFWANVSGYSMHGAALEMSLDPAVSWISGWIWWSEQHIDQKPIRAEHVGW